MPLVYSNINTTENIYGAISLDKVIYDGTTVWTSEVDLNTLAVSDWNRASSDAYSGFAVNPFYYRTSLSARGAIRTDTVTTNEYYDLTNYKYLTLIGALNRSGTAGDSNKVTVSIINKSGTVTNLFNTSGNSTYIVINNKISLASYKGEYKIRVSVQTYNHIASATVNKVTLNTFKMTAE